MDGDNGLAERPARCFRAGGKLVPDSEQNVPLERPAEAEAVLSPRGAQRAAQPSPRTRQPGQYHRLGHAVARREQGSAVPTGAPRAAAGAARSTGRSHGKTSRDAGTGSTGRRRRTGCARQCFVLRFFGGLIPARCVIAASGSVSRLPGSGTASLRPGRQARGRSDACRAASLDASGAASRDTRCIPPRSAGRRRGRRHG